MSRHLVATATLAVAILGASACALRTTEEPNSREACGRLAFWRVSSIEADPDLVVDASHETRVAINLIVLASEHFCTIQHRYPDDLAELSLFASSGRSNVRACLLAAREMRDGWGRRFDYTRSSTAPTISSAGADGTFGNADDIALPRSVAEADTLLPRQVCDGLRPPTAGVLRPVPQQ